MSEKLIYHEIPELSREEALRQLESADIGERAEALIALAYFDPDWRWVQSLCIDAIHGRFDGLRETGILCIGHTARVNRQIDLDIVLPLLYDLYRDPDLQGWAHNALSDIHVFVGFDRKAADKRYGIKT